MSKLTNCQIAAQIRGLESSFAGAVLRGDACAALRTEKKINRYKEELRNRQLAGIDPGTEIQDAVAGLKA